MRGLAIGLVVAFHAYARWPDATPWVTNAPQIPSFKYGYFGVELFFLISGYVIYMTLEKSTGLAQFMYKRWLRLFPAMLIATTLILITGPYLPERPMGPPSLERAMPGLLFIEPHQLAKLLGTEVVPIEGAFWTLFVEVKFYLIFGLLYFFARPIALPTLCIAAAPALLVYCVHLMQAGTDSTWLIELTRLVDFASLKYFGWFAAGALMYQYAVRPSIRLIVAAFVLASLSVPMCIWQGQSFDAVIVGLFVFPMFYVGLLQHSVVKMLSTRVPVFLGLVSYPLYLIHENALVALTVKIHSAIPSMPDQLTPLPAIIFLITVAWLIARLAEPSARAAIAHSFKYIAARSYRSTPKILTPDD
jgi:peptidoglycan/LPS O-acetylase OafA/YrhL